MGHLHCSKGNRENKHLSYRDRLRIECLLREKKSTREISEAIGCSQRTIQRERKRGQVQQLNGSTWEYYFIYDADYAQNDYVAKHECKGPGLKLVTKSNYVNILRLKSKPGNHQMSLRMRSGKSRRHFLLRCARRPSTIT